jgi:hypothetical protein
MAVVALPFTAAVPIVAVGFANVTPPLGVAHVPSPRQNVEDVAPEPPLRLLTGMFPRPTEPLVVMVPPVRGELKVMLVTEPPPPEMTCSWPAMTDRVESIPRLKAPVEEL